MYRILLITILTLVLIYSGSKAQKLEIPIPKYEYDTNYIDNFDNKLAIRLVSPRRVFNFRIKNTETKERIGYNPNLTSAFGIGFSYRWLAFDIVFNPNWNKKRNEKYGESKEFNIKGTLYLKRHLIDISFRKYQGMYVTNPQDFMDPWDGTYPKRGDMKNNNFVVSYTIPFNHQKFAAKTAFQLDGRMKKSAGSIISMSTLQLTNLKANSSIVPINSISSFDAYAQISSMSFFLLQQSLGYAYTFIHKKFYISLSAMPGLSFATGSVDSEGGNYKPVSLDFMFASKNGLGYNSRKWYAGVYYLHLYQDITLRDNLAYNMNIGELRVFIGYRIHAPYIVNKYISK